MCSHIFYLVGGINALMYFHHDTERNIHFDSSVAYVAFYVLYVFIYLYLTIYFPCIIILISKIRIICYLIKYCTVKAFSV